VQRFYFDHNATTPVAPEVLEAMVSTLGQTYGNASSIHYFGQAAKQKLEAARRQTASFLHCQPAEIVFTSGGTEADNLAIFGVVRTSGRERRHVVTAPEHPAAFAACSQLEREGVAVTRLPVGMRAQSARTTYGAQYVRTRC
jgi:cysteine desulfurase